MVTSTYNANRELISELYPDGREHSYDYDLGGNRIMMSDPTGVTSFSYDDRNLLREMINPDQKVVSYSYNALGLRTAMTDPDGGVTTYTYDDGDRLTTVTDPRGKTTTQVYDQLGRKNFTVLPNGTTTTQIYNCANWLTQVEHRASDGTLVNQIDYDHDLVGNRIGAVYAPAARRPPGRTTAAINSPAKSAAARPPSTCSTPTIPSATG